MAAAALLLLVLTASAAQGADTVLCPDQSHCSDGSTCCLLQSGKYGCCPYKLAQCCSDHLHCCPEGFRCVVSNGTCVRDTAADGPAQLALVPLQEALDSVQTQTVRCPDGSPCRGHSTCCRLKGGDYGCCVFEDAICCPDHESCCPNGYECASNGTCRQSAKTVPMAKKYPSFELPVSTSATLIRCPDGSVCDEGTSCCPISDNEYGCCPFDRAVCCSDRVHCCPFGYQCRVAAGRCVRKKMWMPMARKYPARRAEPNVNGELIPCPDRTYCPNGSTCCLLSTGGYGCCPFVHAICCSDNLHCCPEGTHCQVSTGSCLRDSEVIPMTRTMPAIGGKAETLDNGELIQCPDQSYCQNFSTCCLLSTGHYGCCPFPNAVCCSDHEHCCPEATRCQASTGSCIRDLGVLTKASPALMATSAPKMTPMAKTLPALLLADVVNASVPSVRSKGELVRCPDQTYCPDGSTCCLLSTGRYGCCPFVHAVCCSDHQHCCPKGTHCQISTGSCIKDSEAAPIARLQPGITELVAARTHNTPNDVTCPDNTHCPDRNTCCQNKQGGYGCCPIPNAVCCSDNKTCCPRGFACQISTGTCTRGADVVPMAKKLPAFYPGKVAVNGEFVRCPDQTYCRDGSTCCLLSTGRYGCCPFAHAVCCSDHQHCCPEGTRCQISTGSCIKGLEAAPIVRSQPGIMELVAARTHNTTNDVTCPDKTHCPDHTTCCQDKRGGYGCCPFPNGVCCSDKETCCPQGSVCPISTGTCTSGADIVPMAKKLPAFYPGEVTASDELSTQCPDGGVCPAASTCCLTRSGRYGCCPFRYGECCSDLVHCCPEGYHCQASGFCARGSTTVAKAKTFPSINARGFSALSMRPTHPVTNATSDAVCPDGRRCAATETCCEARNGTYGCCPLMLAVCCSDKEHCCPAGTTCSLRDNKCYPPGIPCPDLSTCPFGTTCCPMAGARFGCCPYPLATCCLDLVHCCPMGTICLAPLNICILSSAMTANTTLLRTTELRAQHLLDGYVKCPDRSYCPSGSTCCLISAGRYGCCPHIYAECCSDHVHCCPEGYRCQVSTGSCVKGAKSALMKEISPSLRSQLQESTVRNDNAQCPDGSYCPGGSTCCMSTSGRYSCCPYSYAQCCSDHVHCCPEGYRCQISTGSCVRGSKTVLMKEMYRSLPTQVAEHSVEDDNAQCPDGSYCPGGSTCCMSTSGRYSCCPYSYAQCCSDHVHCCPEGYRCQISTGSCIRGSKTVLMKEMYRSLPTQVAEHSVGGDNAQCPDGSYCPGGSTCCLSASGRYACCPYPYAECCSDHVHCCPEGYRCQMSTSSCIKGSKTKFQRQTFPSSLVPLQQPVQGHPVWCPGNITYCSEGSTCCPLASGDYRCCPYARAQCCDDQQHCCAEGYTCEPGVGCTREASSAVQRKKYPAVATLIFEALFSSSVVCPDQTSCPGGSTCCKLSGSGYGCCPFDRADCCEDGVHCCPSGYRCNVSTGTCDSEQEDKVVPMLKKFPSTPAP